jgi:hypothetical protein
MSERNPICVVCEQPIKGRWYHHYRLNVTWCADHNYVAINEAVGEDVSDHAVLSGYSLDKDQRLW